MRRRLHASPLHALSLGPTGPRNDARVVSTDGSTPVPTGREAGEESAMPRIAEGTPPRVAPSGLNAPQPHKNEAGPTSQNR